VFVHLGGDAVVDVRQVVAILDARRLLHSPGARALLERASGGRADGTAAAVEEARAVVVTTSGVCLAAISPETVAKRIRELGHFPHRETPER
jgi:regulator of extracellular matrix RemA (YlzA/DUF370 family)